MRRIIFCSFIILLCIVPNMLNAQHYLIVKISAGEGITQLETDVIAYELENELNQTHFFTIVERNKLNEISREKMLRQAGYSSNNTDEPFVDAEEMVVGDVHKVGENYVLLVKVVSTQTSELLYKPNGPFVGTIEDLSQFGFKKIAADLVMEKQKMLFEKKGRVSLSVKTYPSNCFIGLSDSTKNFQWQINRFIAPGSYQLAIVSPDTNTYQYCVFPIEIKAAKTTSVYAPLFYKFKPYYSRDFILSKQNEQFPLQHFYPLPEYKYVDYHLYKFLGAGVGIGGIAFSVMSSVRWNSSLGFYSGFGILIAAYAIFQKHESHEVRIEENIRYNQRRIYEINCRNEEILIERKKIEEKYNALNAQIKSINDQLEAKNKDRHVKLESSNRFTNLK